MRRRERLEVIYDFLSIVQENQGSIKKTPLLRKTNLSSQSFLEYFDELIAKGFIREQEDNKRNKFITLTDKGYRYISKFKQLAGFINEFGL
ncbi:MAG: winged helix DNA-binding protein [Nanoarchaeota archaeon]|nr:winged helix DNA-binding protein [Nanoarchaeota archaeon]